MPELEARQGVWWSPWWMVLLAVLFAIGDVLLQPNEAADPVVHVGFGLGALFYLCVGVVFGLAVLGSGRFQGTRATTLALVIGVLAALVAGAVGGTLYSSDALPPWRDALLPGATIFAGLVGLLWWFRGDGVYAERLLLVGLVGTGLTGYAQQEPMVWALAAALAGSYAWLWLDASLFSRYTGLVMHMLALVAFLQLQAAWFTWTPFPFLTFFPFYLVGMYYLSSDRPRRVAWWVGIVFAGATFLLGMSTLIAAIVKGLPVLDSIIMVVAGGSFAAAFASMRFIQGSYAEATA